MSAASAYTVSKEYLSGILPRSAHLRPVFEAVRDHGVGLAVVPPGRRPFTLPGPRPRVVLIADDLFVAHGPRGFHEKSMRRLIEASRFFLLSSCKPMIATYAVAAMSAVFGRDALIVETRTEHEEAWIAFVERTNPTITKLYCRVRPAGGVH